MKNSKHFVEIMKGVRIEKGEMLVSFDVASLFTNVPIYETVRVICGSLLEDETLGDRTSLSSDRVAELLDVCSNGLFVSAAVTNLYMEFFGGSGTSVSTRVTQTLEVVCG